MYIFFVLSRVKHLLSLFEFEFIEGNHPWSEHSVLAIEVVVARSQRNRDTEHYGVKDILP
jgi:hypothetical protein